MTLAVVMVLLVVGWSLPTFRQPVKQPRVYVKAEALSRSAKGVERSSVDWREYFRSACPHMALAWSEQLADYTIDATWLPSPRASWTVSIARRDQADTYEDRRLKSPDSIKLLRESCNAIRSDVEDWAGFGREEPPKVTPVGRYALSYHPTNYNQALLLDTKTGAVWELVQDNYALRTGKVNYRQFSRISVDGLYTSMDEQLATSLRIDRSPDSEAKKKADREMFEKSWEEERERENALNER